MGIVAQADDFGMFQRVPNEGPPLGFEERPVRVL
jgi:hypothetical protein